jgi:hypothetical protein
MARVADKRVYPGELMTAALFDLAIRGDEVKIAEERHYSIVKFPTIVNNPITIGLASRAQIPEGAGAGG